MDELVMRFERNTTLLAGIRADGDNLCRLPKRLFKAFSGYMTKAEFEQLVRLTVAGAAQVGPCRASDVTLLLPVELRRVNHTASTNSDYFSVSAACPLKMRLHASNQPH